jgi:hypothetical protein
MQEENNVKPEKKFEIENINDEGKCDIVFYDNIQEEIRNDGEKTKKVYIYDIYRITVRYRDTLEADLEKNYETWLNFAKEEMKKQA